jgi:hypothetical protein
MKSKDMQLGDEDHEQTIEDEGQGHAVVDEDHEQTIEDEEQGVAVEDEDQIYP